MGVAYGFIGFVGGLVVDYFGRLSTPGERSASGISTLDMVELGGLALLGLVGYFSPKNAQWIPISQGLMTGKLYATLWGPRLFKNRYILTTITPGGQLVGYQAGTSIEDVSQFGGSYQTEGLSSEDYPVVPLDTGMMMGQEFDTGGGDMATMQEMTGDMTQFANLGPVGSPDLSDIYDLQMEAMA
jgi:hypothetical protein